jgi:hypothetical protein
VILIAIGRFVFEPSRISHQSARERCKPNGTRRRCSANSATRRLKELDEVA